MTVVEIRSRSLLRALVVLALGVSMAASVSSLERSDAVFTGTTDTAAALAAGSLDGVHGPLDGVARFAAAGRAGTCEVSWTALVGGTAIADRFEVTSEPDGTGLVATAGVGGGSTVVATGDIVSSYGLATRAAATWISADADSLTTTCVQVGLTSVAAGETATCAIDTAALLWCWGLGFDWTNGDDGLITRSTPRQEGAATWRQVDLGVAHACAIGTDDSLWCWGFNWAGQVGDGTSTNRTDPVRVGVDSDWEVVGLSAATSCGIRSGGTLWCWGYNQFGQVGDGTTTNRFAPVQVGAGETWQSVSGGRDHVCAVTTEGTLWCWGAGWNGQLGDGANGTRSVPSQVGADSDWTAALGLGDFHSCAIRTDTTLWCWGANDNGEGGHPALGAPNSPVEVSSGWTQVDAGRHVTCATRLDRSLWCGGTHIDARTGVGLTVGNTAATSFVQVGSAADWRLVSVGARHGCAVDGAGTLSCWGNAGVGQTGRGNGEWANPTVVGAAADWVQMALGDRTTCGRRGAGTLWCWGWNQYGQVGQGTADDGFATPTQVQPGTTWLDVGLGEYSVCAIRSDRTLWCWGAGWDGQLGTGDVGTRLTPSQVGSAGDWASLGVGRSHSCAINLGGELWCWGGNWDGRVGDGTSGNIRTTPVRVGTKTDWAQVSAAGTSTCGVDDAGDLWCWGSDAWGKLGSNYGGSSSVPVAIDSAMASVDVGDDHACSLDQLGQIWCWGRNDFGAVGDGTTVQRGVPTLVAGGVTTWRQPSVGWNYSCATRTDDTVYCWGNNVAGQFGNGTTSTVNTAPVALYGGTAAVEAASGRAHTCGIATGGNLACAGVNDWSQLGYASLTTAPTAVAGGAGPWAR